MNVAFVGDFMLSGDQTGINIIVSKRLKRVLSSFDIRVATLETAIGTYDDIDEIKSPKGEVAVWSKAEDLHKLTDLNINVVSLANNHSCDCGVGTMLRLLDTLHNMGITPIGAGRDIREAMKPTVFEKDGESLAIVACCKDDYKSLGTLHFATETKGGIYRLEEEVILPQIRDLKQQYTYVAIVVHWGVEHRWLPENDDVTIGHKLIDAGADIIIGGHPHHIQPQETYNSHPIFYSLGNYYFPDFCLDKVSNVYYPTEEEFKKLPAFDWMAPERRNFSMLYYWTYYARLGLIAPIVFRNKHIKVGMQFVLYKKGKLSLSLIGWWQELKLKMLACLVGKDSSFIINYLLSVARNIVEYKILGRFIKKYSFHKYIKTHNFDN